MVFKLKIRLIEILLNIGNVAEAISTFSITKRWKKNLRRVRSKIKKKDDETDKIKAAHVTHKWKRQMRQSKKESHEGEVDSNRRKSEISQKSRRRKLNSKRDNEVSEFLDDGTNIINNTTKWNVKVEKSDVNGQAPKD